MPIYRLPSLSPRITMLSNSNPSIFTRQQFVHQLFCRPFTSRCRIWSGSTNWSFSSARFSRDSNQFDLLCWPVSTEQLHSTPLHCHLRSTGPSYTMAVNKWLSIKRDWLCFLSLFGCCSAGCCSSCLSCLMKCWAASKNGYFKLFCFPAGGVGQRAT